MNLSSAPEWASAALSGLSVVPDDVVAAQDQKRRREELSGPAKGFPFYLQKYDAKPQFLAEVARWTPLESLILIGPTGSGKSGTMARLAAKLYRAGVDHGGAHMHLAQSCAWISADDLTRAGGGDQTNQLASDQLLHRARYCRVLFLDEIGKLTKTTHAVLKARANRRLPTVCSGGQKTAQEFGEAVGGQAVARWIIEGGEVRGRLVSGW